jgi:aspartate kinase
MESDGSTIHINGENDSDVPSYIFKPNQILLSISTKDYSFIFEDHLSDLFHLFSENGLKVHLMQNSALSFSICGHIKQPLVPKLIKALSKKYLVKYNEKVDLLTVRHYQKFDLPNLVANQEILIQQRSRSTIRYVLRKSN